MREFVRHPSNIPIEIEENSHLGNLDSKLNYQCSQLNNLSYGGISCVVDHSIEQGVTIKIRIPILRGQYEGEGVVVWCRPNNTHFDVGIQFIDKEEAFKSKMVEQVCQIESYRQAQEQLGRELTSEAAANEWIHDHAADFADKYAQTH